MLHGTMMDVHVRLSRAALHRICLLPQQCAGVRGVAQQRRPLSIGMVVHLAMRQATPCGRSSLPYHGPPRRDDD